VVSQYVKEQKNENVKQFLQKYSSRFNQFLEIGRCIKAKKCLRKKLLSAAF
jgi:hypothetical protein